MSVGVAWWKRQSVRRKAFNRGRRAEVVEAEELRESQTAVECGSKQ